MLGNCCEDFARGVVEQLHLAAARRVARTLLLQHLDHHVVRGFVDEGDQHLLTVEQEIQRCRAMAASETSHTGVMSGRRESVAKHYVGLGIDVAGFRGAHVRIALMVAVDSAFRQKRWVISACVGNQSALHCPQGRIFHHGEQVVQGRGAHHVFAGEIGRDGQELPLMQTLRVVSVAMLVMTSLYGICRNPYTAEGDSR